jgi:hypothetical protein
MTGYPATVVAEQDALVSLVATVWYAAACPDHGRFDDSCPRCLTIPQNCPEHTPVEPGVSNPVGWCTDCQRLRPGSQELGPVLERVVSAEQALTMLGLPLSLLKRGRMLLRVPWKGAPNA